MKGEHTMLTKTVYECVKVDLRYRPSQKAIIHYAQTELEALEWLSNNGGGLYRNTLHNFEFNVKAGDYICFCRDHECEECGKHAVTGAEELLISWL